MLDQIAVSVAEQMCTLLGEAERGLRRTLGARALAPDAWLKEVHEDLEVLRSALAVHINMTEADDGLLSQILEDEPRLAAKIEVILADHGELCEAMDQALDVVDHDGPVNAGRIRWELSDLIGRVATHRGLATDLVFDAYTIDIGGNGPG